MPPESLLVMKYLSLNLQLCLSSCDLSLELCHMLKDLLVYLFFFPPISDGEVEEVVDPTHSQQPIRMGVCGGTVGHVTNARFQRHGGLGLTVTKRSCEGRDTSRKQRRALII